MNSSITFSNTPDLEFGKVSDLGTAVTITKTGTGRLILDNRGTGAASSTLSAGTVFDVQEGQLFAKGSSVAGSPNPLGLATVNLKAATC